VFQLHLPLIDRSGFAGTLVVEYSIDTAAAQPRAGRRVRRHMIARRRRPQQLLASTVSDARPGEQRRAPIVSEAPLGAGRHRPEPARPGLPHLDRPDQQHLFWMVVALSVLTVWMLLGTWRHMRRRAQIQAALVQETNFRRAMENSMPTGMRAMDLEGRISYVNAAFCQMTGFTEPSWSAACRPSPTGRPTASTRTRLLQQELQGRSPTGGIEVKVMRKDGSRFDARMYVSPLIDPRGQQTGWMTSMTNITEAKRIRDQLSASHERFTTVLEGLDASVSVLSVQQGELLFANRSYRCGSAAMHAATR
jgi:PAS domain S-box-containing protein